MQVEEHPSNVDAWISLASLHARPAAGVSEVRAWSYWCVVLGCLSIEYQKYSSLSICIEPFVNCQLNSKTIVKGEKILIGRPII